MVAGDDLSAPVSRAADEGLCVVEVVAVAGRTGHAAWRSWSWGEVAAPAVSLAAAVVVGVLGVLTVRVDQAGVLVQLLPAHAAQSAGRQTKLSSTSHDYSLCIRKHVSVSTDTRRLTPLCEVGRQVSETVVCVPPPTVGGSHPTPSK